MMSRVMSPMSVGTKPASQGSCENWSGNLLTNMSKYPAVPVVTETQDLALKWSSSLR